MLIEMRCATCGKLLFKHKGNNFIVEAKCTRCGSLNTFSFFEYNCTTKVISKEDTKFTS